MVTHHEEYVVGVGEVERHSTSFQTVQTLSATVIGEQGNKHSPHQLTLLACLPTIHSKVCPYLISKTFISGSSRNAVSTLSRALTVILPDSLQHCQPNGATASDEKPCLQVIILRAIQPNLKPVESETPHDQVQHIHKLREDNGLS